MKYATSLLVLALLPVWANANPIQTSAPADISVTRTQDGIGWDISLSPGAREKIAAYQIWLVVDGKSEGLYGDYYYSDSAEKPLRYTGSVSSDLDSSVKDILKAQGFPIKANIITYRIGFSVNSLESSSISKTLHFRHGCNILADTQFPVTAQYNVGDKIPVFEAVALDSSITMREALGPNEIGAGRYVRLPNDLLHRITIQVQFLPKTTP